MINNKGKEHVEFVKKKKKNIFHHIVTEWNSRRYNNNNWKRMEGCCCRYPLFSWMVDDAIHQTFNIYHYYITMGEKTSKSCPGEKKKKINK